MSTQCFIHVDLDAFYASVEQLDNPEYRNKPVIVGSLPTDRRGVVSTCSYEARKYGVHSAMPIANAFKLCPHGIFVRGRMDRYQEKSREVMNVFAEFSPDIQQISVDEAFIDITGTERLFGTPEEVAKMLKKRVLEKTKLTVSVGVGPTKYIAKICSGMSKPDGLFIVEPGKEQDFMLSLPLKKVWGIGEKTLAKIKAAGFYTNKDIYNASESLLKTLLGNATGTFLYNAVRGSNSDTFSNSQKSHSLSSEKTFSFDLTDRYTIESALMELSWEIMYRLFTEKLTSKTAQLKIRYEDFTTITVQETSTWNISSADDLFSRIKKLFDKKYETGRGIRLLGIATQNVEKNAVPTQGDLFDYENEKKAKLEKTVIEIKKKNPNLQIKKARLIKTFSILALILVGHFFPLKLYAEDPIAIFNVTPDSPEVEFYAEGSWEAKLLTEFDLFKNETTNNSLGITLTPPVFIQKTDLSMWFLLLNSWYFEATMADDFLESTIAAGYMGEGYLKHARIGNRLIEFPQFYGVNKANRGIGSGSNQAPGIMAEFSDTNWRSDAIIRYDMTESLEKTWIGNSELAETNIKLSSWEKGARFILPENSVEHINGIFVETSDEEEIIYKDENNIEYRKLTPSEYLLIPSKNMIVFDKPQRDSILVTFSIKPNLGEYSSKTGFLGDIQNYFENIDLENFSLGNKSDNFFIKLDGTEALILQKDNYFSPFADASLYAISATSTPKAVSVISESTKITIDDYNVNIVDSTSMLIPGFTNTDVFNEKNNYIQAYSTNEASSQFPFAKENPLLYLTPFANENNTQKENDAIIFVQSFSQSPILDIGTDAIPGSVTVYRNGIKDNLFTYNEETGIVSLSNVQTEFDEIRITWQQNTETATTGTLTGGIGYQYIFSDNLKANISSSVLWPILKKDAFTTNNTSTTGAVNLAVDVEYNKNDLALKNILTTTFYTDDITNKYQIDSMDSSRWQQKNLTKYAGLKNNPELVPNLAPLKNLNLADKGSSTTETIRNAGTGSYIVKNTWNIEKQNGYIYQTIDFSGQATGLASSSAFSMVIKQENLPNGYKMYLQLGVNDNESALESAIPTWELTSKLDKNVEIPFDKAKTGWQKICVTIKDEDRAKLAEHQNARIILVKESSATTDTGIIEVYGYEFTGTEFRLSETITGKETYESKRKDITQYFAWDATLTSNKLNAIKYYDAIPFPNYKYFNFAAYIPDQSIENNTSMQIIFDTQTDFGSETALDITLKSSALEKLKNSWHDISVDLYNKSILIDGQKLDNTHYSITTIDTTINPTRTKFTFTGKSQIYIDEMTLTEATWNFKAENALDVKWSKNEVLVGNEEKPVIANPTLTTHTIAMSNTPFETAKTTDIAVTSENSAGIDILGIRTKGSMGFSSNNAKDSFTINTISHNINSLPVFLPFQFFAFSENYSYNPLSSSAKKNNTFELNFAPLDFNLSTAFSTEAQILQENHTQNVQIENNLNIGTNLTYNLHSTLFANQQILSNKLFNKKYFATWQDVSSIQFSAGFNDASKRNIGFSLSQSLAFEQMDFKPKLILNAENIYEKSNGTVNSSSDSITTQLPFSIKNNMITIELANKSMLDSELIESTNYSSDAHNYIKNMKYRTWAYKSFPIYNFFDKKITNNMQSTLNSNSELLVAGYTSQINTEWSRELLFSQLDLFIPKSIGTQFSRDIRASKEDVSDIFQFATNFSFLSLNNFGRYGYKPIFNWYEQDEIMQSLKIAYKVDRLDTSNWRLDVSGYNQTTLYITQKDTLQLLTEGQIDTEKTWKIKHSTEWNRAGKTSILVDGLYALFPSVKEKNLGFNRSNKLSIGFANNANSKLSQQYGLSHKINIHVHKFAQVGLELGTDIRIEEANLELANMISISGKIQF